MGHGGWQGHRQYPEAKPFCFDPGSIVITGNHKRGKDDSIMKMPEIECDVYEEYLSIPHFEREEENTSKTKDLSMVPIFGIAARNSLSAIKILKFFEPKCVKIISKDCKKFSKVHEVVQDICAVVIFVIYCFELNFTIGGCFF